MFHDSSIVKSFLLLGVIMIFFNIPSAHVQQISILEILERLSTAQERYGTKNSGYYALVMEDLVNEKENLIDIDYCDKIAEGYAISCYFSQNSYEFIANSLNNEMPSYKVTHGGIFKESPIPFMIEKKDIRKYVHGTSSIRDYIQVDGIHQEFSGNKLFREFEIRDNKLKRVTTYGQNGLPVSEEVNHYDDKRVFYVKEFHPNGKSQIEITKYKDNTTKIELFDKQGDKIQQIPEDKLSEIKQKYHIKLNDENALRLKESVINDKLNAEIIYLKDGVSYREKYIQGELIKKELSQHGEIISQE